MRFLALSAWLFLALSFPLARGQVVVAPQPQPGEAVESLPADVAAPPEAVEAPLPVEPPAAATEKNPEPVPADADQLSKDTPEVLEVFPAVVEESQDPVWLPNWPMPIYGWHLGPVVGFRYGVEENAELGHSNVSTVEGGLLGSVSHIPVVDSSPGDWLSPFAGLSYGYTLVRGDNGGSDKYHYRRAWAGVQNKLMWGPLKYELTFSRGSIDYPEKMDLLTQSFGWGNDFGALLLDWWSLHETLNYSRGFQQDFYAPFLQEYDNWIHSRMKFKPMDIGLDLGPGFTQSNAIEPLNGDRVAGLTRYVKGTLDFTFLWGLGGSALAKYAFDSSESRLGVYDRRRMPTEALNEPVTLTMPEDSFQGSTFLGFKDIMFGIGFGWRYNISIISFGGRQDRERETRTDQGFGLYKEMRF